MKKLGLFIFIALLSLNSFSQDQNIPQGIYKTFTEFKEHSPSLQLTDSLITKNVRYGFWGMTSKERIQFQNLNIDRKEANSIKKAFAVVEGQNIYVKTNKMRIHPKSKFAKAELAGKYILFTRMKLYMDRRLPFLWWTSPIDMFIDYKSGDIMPLSRFEVKRQIKDNAELLKKFKQDKQKNQKLKEYLFAYSMN